MILETHQVNRYRNTTEGWNRMGEKILVIGCDEAVVHLVEINLVRTGYSAHATYHAKEALERLDEINPKLIVLDDTPHDMAGQEVIKMLRETLGKTNLPIVWMVSKDNISSESHNVAPFICKIYKPFAVRDLIIMIKSALRRDYWTIYSGA